MLLTQWALRLWLDSLFKRERTDMLMVDTSWTYPLYKIACATEKMIPLNTSFLNCSWRLTAEQETVKNHFHKLKCCLNLDISSQSFGSHHLLSVLYCSTLWMGIPAINTSIVPVATRVIVWKSVPDHVIHVIFLSKNFYWFLFSWGDLCLALILP